ncbi:MAG: phosphoenolpyruvate synthase [Patescibacteria group bacterium]|jgi:pyruvate,water dikinase
MAKYIRWFKDLRIEDIPQVGGKNASLGEMVAKLAVKGVPVPNGFALTADAYRFFISENLLDKKIKEAVTGLDTKNVRALSTVGSKVRKMILEAKFPEEMKNEIISSYNELSKMCGVEDVAVAVRSSATAEDLPDASFAGQQETYLNVRGPEELMDAARKCISSLFTDRAISYREDKGFDQMAIALSVGVQQMVRSDIGTSGVMFTLDTESGYKGVVLINAAYGLGDFVVQGSVTPDQFYVFKEGVKLGLPAVMSKRLGSKEIKEMHGPGGRGVKEFKVKLADRKKFCINDDEVLALAKWGMIIEEHYGHPMDIEWAKDGNTGKMYIVQARAETVASRLSTTLMETYKLGKRSKVLLTGSAVGQRIGQGKVHIIDSPKQMKNFKPGEVLVTRITDPDWEPIMKIAGAIVTEQGGKTSHAAIVSRELGITCVVGAADARKILKRGEVVTVSCAEGETGIIYEGLLPFEVEKTEIKKFDKLRTKIMMNVGDPERAFALSRIPNDGVGLAREEFIYTDFIKIHPMALINYNKIKDKAVKKQIDELTVGYTDKVQYAIDKLAEGIAYITAPFYPNDVIVRLSDFKTNEYATLIGGHDYEPKEENPMIGWRGASRYYDEKFKPAFKIECEAIKKVRNTWGMKNLIVMVPFCRTVEEGKKVLAVMKEYGLEKGKDGLQVYVMCEIPANVILAKEFCEIFDGFSIGSNDLTQLTLGVDRDSAVVSHVYDEKNAAVKKLIREVIKVAHENKRHVGICGQAPSDYPEFAEFLVQEGIDSISLNPDTVLKTRERIAAMEKKVGTRPSAPGLSVAVKAASFFGVIGVSLILVGFTCQSVSNAEIEQRVQSAVSEQVLQVSRNLRERYEAMQAERERAARQIYAEENDYVKLQLSFPATWHVEHRVGTAGFISPEGTKKFSFSKVKKADPASALLVATSTWNGFETKTFNLKTASTSEKIIDLYPLGYKKSTYLIRFNGEEGVFDGIWKTLQVSIP